MDLLELRRLYDQASKAAYWANNHRDEALLADDDVTRDRENFMYEQSIRSLEEIEAKIHSLKLEIPSV